MKKFFGSMMALAMTAMMMTSCSTPSTPVSALDGEWNITTVATDSSVLDVQTLNVHPYIAINVKAGQFSGMAACNRIMGKLVADTLKAGEVAFADIASTRMMCPSMDVEQAVLNALSSVASFKSTTDSVATLQLFNAAGKQVLTLVHRAAYLQLEGEWNFVSAQGKALENAESTPFIAFELTGAEQKLHGCAGCNNFFGVLNLTEGNQNIAFKHIGVTEKMCENMEVEDAVLAALSQTTSYEVKNVTLYFYNANHEVVAELRKN